MPRAAALALALVALLLPTVSSAAERCVTGPVVSGADPGNAQLPATPASDSTVTVASLNTMNVGWMDSMWPVPFQHQADVVRSMLSKAGFATPFGDTRPTFKFLGLPLKLDWLYFRKLETQESGVDDVELSDHRGIWTRVGPPVAAGDSRE